ncbi:MAG: hypothetical protein NVS9B12_11190 [Vulcanimicrobiaceae bacterium]
MTSLPRALLPALALLAALHGGPVLAQPATETTLSTILRRLAADPATPNEYTATVKLHVHMRMFPWISVTLNGNQAYKRPGLYHFVFRDVPQAAEHFHDLNYDLGNPLTWPKKYDIALVTPPSTGIEPVIRLTPKKRGMVKHLDVTVDFSKGHIDKAVWERFDGGVISLLNHYSAVGVNEIVAQQAATIDIPHMKADVEAEYSQFAVGTNSISTAP